VNVLLLGPQGSGKGTQAKRIAAEYGVPHVATGDMFRDAIAAQSELGRRVAPILARGELVPDELTVALIRQRLEEEDADSGFVLDGFPRTIAQAEALDELLPAIGRELDVVFEFQLSDAIAMQRMEGRAHDEGRIDDARPEVMRRRLEIYRRETQPLVEYYRARHGNVVGLHAERTIDEVFAEVQDALEQVAARS
jgi:adenylate kinase